MTISTSVDEIQYAGNGTADTFAYTWKIIAESELQVALILDTTGARTPQTLTTHYTVTGEGDNAGGSVVFVTEPPTGYTVDIRRVVDYQQTTDFRNQGSFFPESHEDAFDRMEMQIQQLARGQARSIKADDFDVAPDFVLPNAIDRVNKVITFDADGNVALSVGAGGADSTLRDDLAADGLTQGDNLVRVAYDAIEAVPLNLHDYIEDTGEFLLMGFVPQNLKSAIRARTSTTDISTYFQSCVDALVDERVFGTVKLPMGKVAIEATVNVKEGINIVGAGGLASRIDADDCDGFTLDYTTGFGDLYLADFLLYGTAGTTRSAIYQAGTLDDSDEIYGVKVRNVLLQHWNVGIKLRSVRNLEIVGNWMQYIDRGVELLGKNIVVHIMRNKIERVTGGGGTGLSASIVLNSFDYTSGGGVIPPEGVQIISNLLYGADTAMYAGTVNVFNFIANDCQSYVHGVYLNTAQLVCNITDNFFDQVGANVVAGVYGIGLGTVPFSKTHIARNGFTVADTVTATGVKINDAGTQNQNFVTVEENYFRGYTSGDIILNNPGHCSVINNKCESSAPTSSIVIGTVVVGSVYVDRNQCAKVISWQAADAAAGKVVLGHNTINDTTQLVGSQQVPTVASATAVTLPLGSDIFIISGTTTITSIVATGWVGRTVRLMFQDVLTFTDGSNLELAGNFVTSASDVITLVCVGATWVEVSRSSN